MQLFNFAVAALSFGFISSTVASPVGSGVATFEKRQNADIETILTTLNSTIAPILPQISAIASSGNITEDALTPLFGQLTSALDTASSSLGGLSPASLSRRQSDDDIAQLTASIVTDIADALQGLTGSLSTLPFLGGLLGGLDASLDQVLKGLEILLAGVLNLVAQLLVDVAGLLRQLALGLTLGSLGL